MKSKAQCLLMIFSNSDKWSHSLLSLNKLTYFSSCMTLKINGILQYLLSAHLLNSFSQFRSSRSQMLLKIGVLKNFANLTGKQLCWRLFLITLQALNSKTLSKRDSNTGVFLWNLRNFSEHLFYGTPLMAASVNWLCQYLSSLSIFLGHFPRWKCVWGYSTLFILWFINFNIGLSSVALVLLGLLVSCLEIILIRLDFLGFLGAVGKIFLVFSRSAS